MEIQIYEGVTLTVMPPKFKDGERVKIGKIHSNHGSIVARALTKYVGRYATVEKTLPTKSRAVCVRPDGASGTLRLNPDEIIRCD